MLNVECSTSVSFKIHHLKFKIDSTFVKIFLMKVNTMAEMMAKGETPEILFWVGCSGSFDQRAQKITKAFATILDKVGCKYAILGKEEACTGDPARRAGNEFLFQMMAYQNIQVLNGYGIKKIVTTCPHCFNILKNEYPELGGNYEVIHHTTLLQQLIDEGKIKMKEGGSFKGKKISYHDSCYLGRANDIYEAPRKVLEALDAELVEMKRCRSNGLCCGAGGAQMFKEDEPGDKRINVERTDEALKTGASVIASACPFCNTMLTDGVKNREKENEIAVMDVAELIAASMQ
jgi:heterodisulfide reductase subunit D